MRALLPIPIARGTQHTTYAYIHNLIIIVLHYQFEVSMRAVLTSLL